MRCEEVPWRTSEGIYLLFDFVHLMKNIRNNWITEKNQQLAFSINGIQKIAKWEHIQNLHRLETVGDSPQHVKMSKLTNISVYPKPIERQKVKFCMQVFCETTIAALQTHPDLTDIQDTAMFMSKVLEFWNIVNTKSPFSDVRLRDETRSVIRNKNDVNLQKLLEFGNMALEMSRPTNNKTCDGKRFQSLTKDTGKAIWHTCNGLNEMAQHLLQTTHQYVLLGEFTTDHLEKQFGKLRQGSGGAYFITAQQVIEKVGIYKTKLLLKLDTDILKDVNSIHNCDKCAYILGDRECAIFETLDQLEDYLPQDVKMTLVYIAGYVIKKQAFAVDETFFYYEKFGEYFKTLNRGGLTIPGDHVCQWVYYCYILFRDVANDVCRKSLSAVLFKISEFYDLHAGKTHCITMSNILINNHCHLYTPRSSKERKQKVLKLQNTP